MIKVNLLINLPLIDTLWTNCAFRCIIFRIPRSSMIFMMMMMINLCGNVKNARVPILMIGVTSQFTLLRWDQLE